ncbi:MAG: ABC transporter permease [Ktedonobacteraceae bacterium]|nr:ABC transporter permease [Ktedonobacteraceae bacterium]
MSNRAYQVGDFQQSSRRGLILVANFKNALKSLVTNGMRSLLTMLGVIIGVAAVISATILTQGVSANINQNITGLGTNTLTVVSGAASKGGALGGLGSAQTLTVNDIQAIAKLNHVLAASPILNTSAQVIYGNQNWSTRIQGVYPSYQTIQNWQLSSGSWFSTVDEAEGSTVAVLGQTVVNNLFSNTGVSPVGKTVRIGNQNFRVVGTLQPKSDGGSVDDVIYIPFATAQQRLNNTPDLSQVQLLADDVHNVDALQQNVTTLLSQQHHIPPGQAPDFTVFSANQLLQSRQQSEATLSALLIGLAAVSLTVGGIGIMNIMLVSVTERTREIGIRMAIGARRSDIRNQFLIEAVTLSAIGGILGILVGLFGGMLLDGWLSNSGAGGPAGLPFVVDPTSVVVAFTVSAIIGIVFGLYPAVRASQLDPIVALRTE